MDLDHDRGEKHFSLFEARLHGIHQVERELLLVSPRCPICHRRRTFGIPAVKSDGSIPGK